MRARTSGAAPPVRTRRGRSRDTDPERGADLPATPPPEVTPPARRRANAGSAAGSRISVGQAGLAEAPGPRWTPPATRQQRPNTLQVGVAERSAWVLASYQDAAAEPGRSSASRPRCACCKQARRVGAEPLTQVPMVTRVTIKRRRGPRTAASLRSKSASQRSPVALSVRQSRAGRVGVTPGPDRRARQIQAGGRRLCAAASGGPPPGGLASSSPTPEGRQFRSSASRASATAAERPAKRAAAVTAKRCEPLAIDPHAGAAPSRYQADVGDYRLRTARRPHPADTSTCRRSRRWRCLVSPR